MPTTKNINNLVINKVENQDVYNHMVANNLVNDDELYLIQNDGTDETITEMMNYIQANSDAIQQHANDTTAHITAAERAAWNAAEDNAKAYTDTIASAKQNTLVGTHGQVVGFDANGNAVAQDDVQSNWSINDPSNPAYIHNRPFYTTDPTNITLLSGTYSFRQTGDALYAAQLGTMSQVVAEGQTLSVTYNGSVHDAVVATATIAGAAYLYAGNISMLNSIFGTSFTNTNEPFVLIFSNTTSVLYTSAVPSNTNVAINTVTSEIITIPHEYLGLNVDNGAGDYAVVEGFNTTADGQYAHAEGTFTEASGLAAHAEGSSTRATGVTAHAEGTGSVASGDYSHAEGNTTQATKAYAHSEGYYTEATGEYGAHAEGYFAVASGGSSHAEGSHTQAKGDHSHAEGFRTIAAGEHQHVEGQYNIEDTESKYIHIAGNGSKDGPVRSNAYTLDWDGNAWFKGDVKVGGSGYDSATDTLATATYVDVAVASSKADWDQNDENGAGYVKNRTHWLEKEKIVEIVMPSITKSGMADNFATYGDWQYRSLSEDNEYVVIFDGVEYKETAYWTGAYVIIGDGRLDEANLQDYASDVPFYIRCSMMESGSLWEIRGKDNNTHTIEIQYVYYNQTYHKLAAEFIPQFNIPVLTSGTPFEYTATIDGLTSLYPGMTITVRLHAASQSTTPKLNVNGLGAKQIKRRLSSFANNTTATGYDNAWLKTGQPYTLMYDGAYWIVEGAAKPDARDLAGITAIVNGGTGATDIATARTNLGVYSKTEVDNALTSLSSGADWAQNDSNAADYVKNRTHWIGKEYSIIDDAVLIPYQYAVGGAMYYETAEHDLNNISCFINYRAFAVIVNGETYFCEPWAHYFGDTMIGDSRLQKAYDPDTNSELDSPDMSHPENVPFLLSVYAESVDDFTFTEKDIWYVNIAYDGNPTIEVKGATATEVYYPLDEQFIPETIARKSDLADAMPTVTAADNGKFLRVVDGVWAATIVPSARGVEF